ncbi:endoplasmic reticulum protein [Trichosporon asahii var. asahii CBS 8904]|uniref:Endoplasmic reticulum protein n=1 Tax=Trichosporon asahii var. asahii (strain CBS 8904) TaxID=1220162 RepID=K1V303_TRIAC|nr:endoplasmic reticulum protein [Trichosporon asahii var. asahii CBS 8904]
MESSSRPSCLSPSGPIGDPSPTKKLEVQAEEDDLAKQNAALKSSDGDMVGKLIIRRTFDKSKDALTFMGQPVNSLTATVDPPKADQQTMAGRAAQAYRQLASAPTTTSTDHYHCVLKGEVLYIYDNDTDDKECLAAIPMNKYNVEIEDKKGKFDGMEGKFFTKRHSIVLRYADTKRKGLPVLAKGMSSESNTQTKEAEKAPMEDWYFSLLNVAANKARHDRVFSLSHMKWLCERVQSQPDPSGLQWLNAMLGRIFLGVNHTAKVEQKLSLINPPIVGPLRATEVNIGNIPPILSNAMLKEMKPNGEIVFEARIDYKLPADLDSSCGRATIEATKLGFNAIVAARMRGLSGNIRIVIKGPPSDRIWWCFTEQPKMDLDIEPVVGPRAIKWGTLLSFIQKKMREGMAEAIVAPNMDDVPFFHTDGLDVRGGIFNVASRASAKAKEEEEDEKPSDEETEEDTDTPSTLRQRNGKAPVRQNTAMPTAGDDWAERHAMQRSETTPNLTARKSKPKPTRSSLGKSVTPSLQSSTSTEASHFEIDKADKPPPSVHSTTDRSDTLSTSTAFVHSTDPPSPVSLATSGSTRDRSVSNVSIESDPSKLTSAAILNAVRARDTATIEAQVSVAKQSVKKWGVNLMKKRNKKHGHEDGDEMSSLHSIPSVAEIHAPAPRHDGRSLQERLNAAAANARDHQRTPSAASTLSKSFEKDSSPHHSSTPPSTIVADAPTPSPETSTPAEVESIASPVPSVKSQPALEVPSRKDTPGSDTKSVASSASAKTQPALDVPDSEATHSITPPSPGPYRTQRHDSDPLNASSHHDAASDSERVSKPSAPKKPSSGEHDLAHMFKSAGDSIGETE